MQNSPSGVFLKDEEGRYLFMNRAGERLVGRTDWLGKTDDELIPGRAAGDIRGHDRAVLDESSPRLYDLRLPTPQGARTLSSVKFSLSDAAGRRYVGSITSDVTEQRAADEALREADRRKDQFIATLAHELRNPLAPIRTAVAILGREGTAEPDRAWSRDVIERQVAHLSRLVDDLLDMARVTSGKLLLRRERVALGAWSRPRWRPAGRRSMPPGTGWSCILRQRRRCSTPTRRAWRRCSRTCSTTRRSTRRGAARSSCAPSRREARSCSRCSDNGMGFPPELARAAVRAVRAMGAARSTPPPGSASGSRWCAASSSCTAAR